MLLRQESLPQANIYSSKILFDQMEDRNKKRMNQILRRKKALSTRNKTTKFEEEKSSISPKREKEEANINIFSQFNQSIYNFNYTDENYPKKKLEIKNSVNDINNNNSTNQNSSILNKDSQEKEVNISNIEEDTTDILIPNPNQNINNNNASSNFNKNNKSIVNIDVVDCDESLNDESKETTNYFDSNEFAIKYLSSSLDSFIKLDNHLVAKAKYQNNCFTDSYSQALEMNYNDHINDFKTLHSKNYLVTEIIKEEREKEGETPLKNRNKKEKQKEKERHKNNFNSNNEEKEILKRMERRKAYSKRIRNNMLNKKLKDDLGINSSNKKNADKVVNKSKSCKKLIGNVNLIKGCKNNCIYKNNNFKKNGFYIKRKKNQDDISINNLNNIGRKTIGNINKKLSLNSSFNILSKTDKYKKTITGMNSSKNININNKNEKLYKGVCTSRSNLNIFKNNIISKNKDNLNMSMNNFYPKLIRKEKIRKSKSAKRINDISKKYTLNNNQEKNQNLTNKKLLIKMKKEKINQKNDINNSNRLLKKNPTMGRLTCVKKLNINKKNDSSKVDNLNKTVIISSNKNESSFLSNAVSYKNIKYKKYNNNNNNNIINSRNSMPFKAKTKKIVKNILNTGNKVINKLKMNKSFCFLANKDKKS